MAPNDETISIPAHILGKAQQLREAGFHEASVVMAQSACEIAAERAIAQLLMRRGADYLQKYLHETVGSFNITGRVRDLYVALSGDRVQEQPFWASLTTCVQLRNRVVHAGQLVTADQSALYLQVAHQVIQHLEQRCGELPASVAAVADVSRESVAPAAAPRPLADLPLQ